MKQLSSRSLEDMRAVLLDQGSNGPDPVYRVFTDLGDHFWINKTVILAGKLGKEFPKTFGHYHGVDVDEKYYVASGKGVLQLQKKHMEGGVWKPETVDEVLLIKAGPGDEVIIKPEWGHSWSNAGDEELFLFDNWSTPHSPTDYQKIEELHGLAYYLIEENSEIKTIPNPNYKNLPEPKWIKAFELNL